jgi:hypothetical protein
VEGHGRRLRDQLFGPTGHPEHPYYDVGYNGAPSDNPHNACGRASTYWLDHLGVVRTSTLPVGTKPCATVGVGPTRYPWSTGEILHFAWSSSGQPWGQTAREAVDGWLKSSDTSCDHPGHRELLLNSSFTMMGVGATPSWFGTIGPFPNRRAVAAVEFIR